MRRNLLIALNSIYLLFAGLAVGAPIAIGAIMAPVVFHHAGVNRAMAGSLMAPCFEGGGILTTISMSIMLVVATFEVSYRRRANTQRLLVARLATNIVALLLSVYMSQQLFPMIRQRQAIGDHNAFNALHAFYEQLTWAGVLLGVALIVMTQAINIGPRRDGGHPRQV